MVQIQRRIVSLSQGCRGQIKRNHSRGIDAAEEAVPGAQEEILTGHIKVTDEQIVALASIPEEERPAILEELKKKKPTATENNTASQAEQPETSVQAPITESPPEAKILRQKIAATGKS